MNETNRKISQVDNQQAKLSNKISRLNSDINSLGQKIKDFGIEITDKKKTKTQLVCFSAELETERSS